jgi:hypothetical protein
MDKLLWFNEDISYMFRRNIVEYDMQTASLAVSERYGLIEPVLLEQLKTMPKDQRVKKVGLMQRESKEFSNALIEGIIRTREEFIKINHIEESDILCIHSDAIIFDMKNSVIDKIDNVNFILKESWSSYMRYNGVEIYYDDTDGVITYKGIPKDMLKMHTLGINKYLLQIFRMVESCDDSVITFMRKFQKKYLQDSLPDYYYNSFGKLGDFKFSNLKLFAFIANAVRSDMYEW